MKTPSLRINKGDVIHLSRNRKIEMKVRIWVENLLQLITLEQFCENFAFVEIYNES